MPTTQMHNLTTDQRWCSVLESLRTEQGKLDASTTDDFGNLPLHWACRNDAPIEVVTALLEAFPQGTKKATINFGCLPLHTACWYNTPLEVIKALLLVYPGAALATNDSGIVPLHAACVKPSSHEVVMELLAVYPDGALAANNLGNLPLHTACMNNTPLSIVKALLSSHQSCAMTPNRFGDLALHYACGSDTEIEVIQALLSAFPQGPRVVNNLGNLPLHTACHNNASVAVVGALLDGYQDGAKGLNNYGDLSLHYACRCNSSAEVMALLLRAHPFGSLVSDGAGRLAIDCLWWKKNTNARVERFMDKLTEDPQCIAGEQFELESRLRILREIDDDLHKLFQKSDMILRTMFSCIHCYVQVDHDTSQLFLMHIMAFLSCHIPVALWKLSLAVFGISKECSRGLLLKTDTFGRTPLHYAAMSTFCYHVGTESRCSLSAASYCCKNKDALAFMKSSAYVIFRDILSLQPDAANIRDLHGWLPLTLAMQNRYHVYSWTDPEDRKEHQFLLENDSDSEEVGEDKRGKTEEKARDGSARQCGLMQQLVTATSECLYIPDKKTKMFAFMMASVPLGVSHESRDSNDGTTDDFDSPAELERLGLAFELFRKNPVI